MPTDHAPQVPGATLRVGATAVTLSEPARAAVVSAVTALRWGAVAYGIAVVAPAGADNTAADVVALGVCVFLTAFRTLSPLRLGTVGTGARTVALLDVAVFALVTGWTGAEESPWVFCAMAAIALAAFGWGARQALAAGAVGLVGVAVGVALGGWPAEIMWSSRIDLVIVFTTVVAAAVGVFVRRRLLDAEARTALARGELATLRHANLLLGELSEVALRLPGAFTLRDALERTRSQVTTFLHPRAMAVVTLDEHNDEWTPKMTDRCALRPSYPLDELPEPLRAALSGDVAVVRPRIPDGVERLDPDSSSGLYLPLRARSRTIGVLAMEHPEFDHFDDVDPLLRDGLADVIALTIDNARWFGRLRSLGAEEERIRVARDIHDRLGQWMTYIKLELERIGADEDISRDDLDRLQDDAAEALDELRETLRQLRSGVSDDRPLAVLANEAVARFSDRTAVDAHLHVTHPGQRLPVPVENEVLRILQEALNNVDRHAKADHVEVEWTVEGGNFELVVADDGKGFDPGRAVREQSYGIVGMKERAEVIGAHLRVDSQPGAGTTVRVSAGQVRGAAPSGVEDGSRPSGAAERGRSATPDTGDEPR
jgi:signal transduction histidine kinase